MQKPFKKTDAYILTRVCDSEYLMEVGRKAIEDALIDMRDSRISVGRNNGLVCKEYDGSPSSIIRFGPEVGIRIALNAIAKVINQNCK